MAIKDPEPALPEPTRRSTKPLQTLYRARGKPLPFPDIVRRLSTAEAKGKVEYRPPAFRIRETQEWEARVEDGKHVDHEPERHADLMVYSDERATWRRVASLVTDDADEGSPYIASGLYFESSITIDNAQFILRALDWGIVT